VWGIEGANAWNVTGAVIHPVGKNAELRVEVRYDKASEDLFQKTSNTEGEYKDGAATAHLALLGWF